MHARPPGSGNSLIPSAPDPYKEIAKGLEKEFVQFMIRKMRESIGKDEADSSELDYYNSMMDTEYAGIFSDQNEGKGLQEMILKQIDPRFRAPQKGLPASGPQQAMKAYENNK